MARQVAFTKHEAALLLDAYLKVVSGELSRMDSIKECSRMLRLMAVNSGIEIDDVYRNVNGISFQMASMESAYHGRTMMKPATRLFNETVNLFKTDKEEYKKLLKEAKDMADTKQNNEAAFTSWLSENVSASQQLSELYMALVEIEQQAKKVRLVKRSLYETIDPPAVKKIRANIEQNKVFKFTHKRQWGRITSALNYLVQFAIQNEDKINSKAKAFKNEQFYFVGSQVFEIDDEVKSLLKQKGNAVAIGRSIDTKKEPVIIPLRKEYADNVILFGINDEEQVSRTTMATMKSLRISNKDIKIKVINCLSEEQRTTNKLLKDLAGKGEIEMLNPATCGEELQRIATSIKNREAEQMVLFILGQERFRELRNDNEIKAGNSEKALEDDFGFSSDFSNSSSGDVDFNSYQKVIEYILKNGAEEGVHVVLQIDKPSQLLFSDYMTGKIFFSMFHHVVMLRSDAGAVNSLGMSDDLKLENLSSDIERLRAIYYNEGNDSYTLFSPFDF